MERWIYILFVVSAYSIITQGIEESQFSLDDICPGKVVSPDNCHLFSGGYSSVHCALRCTSHLDCVYSVWDSNPKLCRLCETAAYENCSNAESSALLGYRRIMCHNGGTWDVALGTCHCVAGFAGTVCERRMYDCSEGSSLGYPNGQYDVQPPASPAPFPVWCSMSGGGRTWITRRASPALLFNRTWQNYRDGFGLLTGDHWVGLQPMYHLTNSGVAYSFKIEMQRQDNRKNFQQTYFNFKISDEASQYRLDFSHSLPHSDPLKALGDSLSSALGKPFSTYDVDHDGDVTENCALRHQSGWWFPNPCNLTTGNPLGRLVHSASEIWSGNPGEVFWIDDRGPLAPWRVYMWLARV